MKKVKVKINGVWEEKITINGSTSGFSYQSWLNYVAVRNRTKTVINAGDIDVSTFTGTFSAYYLFANTIITSANLDFTNQNGTSCLGFTFTNCSNLLSLTIKLPSANTANMYGGLFTGTTTLTTLIINNITQVQNSTVYSANNSNNNCFAATTLTSVVTLNFNVVIYINLYLATLTSLNLASVVQVLGQLFDYSAGAAHTITFNRAFTGLSAGDYALIDAAKTTAVARNWTVAGLTYSM